jgi:FMN phosphatase YigB (HAD superfamily)
MLKAILFDLDGTLLDNPMQQFVPAYLESLASFVAPHLPPDRFVRQLLAATAAMNANDGSGPTNEEVFAAAFYPGLGVERGVLEPLLGRFYTEEFPKLRRLTRAKGEARALVQWAFQLGLDVVIATNPLFPRTAIEQRIAWAGVSVDEFPYTLVTTYENMHATKDHPAYYAEILHRLARSPEECLMVGDDWGWDIRPTVELGMNAFWVVDGAAVPPSPALPLAGRGSLAELWRLVQAGNLPIRSAPLPSSQEDSP